MESLRIGAWSGKAKCIGALLCVGGALVTGLYKGKEFYISHHHAHHAAQTSIVAAHKIHMLRGTFFLIAACFSYTTWFILQVCFPPFFICDFLFFFFIDLSLICSNIYIRMFE
jgi:hypothetical protein